MMENNKENFWKEVRSYIVMIAAVFAVVLFVNNFLLINARIPSSSMEETIKLLRVKKPDTKVVVGGAVMTQEYADQIGADAYSKDAMQTVRYCDEVFGVQS